ncbi:MAG: 50S ribosomal protein L16 [Candidatus Peribacteraceae bacterium]|nr:50S ribosomal protein L16 [Candidatus Peribacteraceae bacterium]
MLQPQRTKFRKMHRARGEFHGKATRGAELAFGSYGLKAITGGEITARQLEAARRALTHAVQRMGKSWIRIFPQKAITRKSPEVPMGAGKGAVEFYVALVKRGTIIFELDALPEAVAKEAFRLAAHKLPVTTKFVKALHAHTL